MNVRKLLVPLATLAIAGSSCATGSHGNSRESHYNPGEAHYTVRVLSQFDARLRVTASVPIDGDALEMETTRPAGIKELDENGWPGLVRNLRILDDDGSVVAATFAGSKGWRLARPQQGRLTVQYEVDYGPLAKLQWPAQREAVFADPDHLSLIGRSLFITTPSAGVHRVTFELDPPWRAVTPWREVSATRFVADSRSDLVNNLLVISRSRPAVITSGGFRLLVAATGQWSPVRRDVGDVLEAVVPRLVALVGSESGGNYLVVLLPAPERGGESFRGSFALTSDVAPSAANRGEWGNLIAHEVFHYWNGWRLRGSDYAASQWFQEGFTEYAANLSMAASGQIDEAAFHRKLSDHIRNYERLETPLAAPGSSKGPPLYSGGALVAFSWDVLLRHATGGSRTIRDVYRSLWDITEEGRIEYDWSHVEAALSRSADLDWCDFHRRHIEGTERLPLAEIVSKAGLRIMQGEGGTPHVEKDPEASAAARALRRSLLQP